jgi:mannose-6-phosphate isomerase-like protein (cupin superfamily)
VNYIAMPSDTIPATLLDRFTELDSRTFGLHAVLDVEASRTGELLRSETLVQPGGGAGPMHRHRFQTEQFEILEGEIVARLGRSRLRVKAGERFFVPADAPHTFSVETPEPARLVTEFRPGLRLAEFFVQLFALADASPKPSPLQLALLARAYPNEFFYLPSIPAPLQLALARPLAALGRARGYSADPAGLRRESGERK